MGETYGDPGPGSPVPVELAQGLKELTGVSLDNVKVQYNSLKPVALGAKSLTEGSTIYLGPGQERHLPHELWHAVQQAQGRVQPTIQRPGVGINNDQNLEAEADAMGARAGKEAEWMATRATQLYLSKLPKT